VKGRISALTPRHSTRMGTAVRHASRKLKDVASRAKLLILLSDGLPEDSDYGPDKHTPTYGLRDTMMALREAERYGILPFCLTVDKGGHDYLRELCAPSRYMVIEDVTTLPLELPKIYQQHIRAREV
jgi:nitric oxide reductase NorD protein